MWINEDKEMKREIQKLEAYKQEASILHEEAQARLNGLKELQVIRRALRRCKWYDWVKKRTLEAYADIIKKTYNL